MIPDMLRLLEHLRAERGEEAPETTGPQFRLRRFPGAALLSRGGELE